MKELLEYLSEKGFKPSKYNEDIILMDELILDSDISEDGESLLCSWEYVDDVICKHANELQKQQLRKFDTIESIREFFINDGWGKNTDFTEYSFEDAQKDGCLSIMENIKKGKKYFKMNITGNVFDDNGNISFYNIKTKPRRRGKCR